MKSRLKASLTVFFALIMVAVMTLLFTMTECIRAFELHSLAQEYTDMAVESTFSEYNPYLWSNYRILAVDLGYGTDAIGPGIMEQKTVDYCRVNSDIELGSNYARLSPDGCVVSQYTLLTDDSGQGVITLGSKAARDGLAAQVVDMVQGQTESVNKIEKVSAKEKAEGGKKQLNEAKDSLAQAKYNADHDDDPNTSSSDYPEPGEVEDDPLDAFETMKESFSKGILSTVVDVETASDYQANLDSLPSHRQLNAGNLSTEEAGLVDRALFIDYLLTSYSYYGKDMKHDGYKYEVEYLIAGKGTDTQNLATVVEEIMLTREAANFATIMSNPSMVAQAASLAEILAGFTMNPVIIEAVKIAIIGAWAYIESTLDLRTILSGGKVPLIKSIDDWTSDVFHLSAFLDVNQKAKESQMGIGYKEYLIGLLAIKTDATLGIRACDVMENALSETEDYKNVKMDNMMFAGDISIDYSADEMFLSLLPNPNSFDGYAIRKSKMISY